MPDARTFFRCLPALLAVIALTVLAAPAAAAPSASATDTSSVERFAQVVVDSMSPSMVTTTSGPTVRVRGEVHNRSSRTLRTPELRLERGAPVRSAAGLRTSLAVAHPPVAVSSPFRTLAPRLKPGDTVHFDVSMPLSDADGLQISRTGVYPLQVNVNAVPDYGSMAQVAGSRTMLPVLSLPPDRDRAARFDDEGSDGDADSDTPGPGPDGSVPADASDPGRLTMLWPVAAPPQLAPGVLGGRTEPVRLISEDLAHSVESGRLHALLQPLRQVVGDPGPSEAGSGSLSGSGSTLGSAPSGSGGSASGSTGSPAPGTPGASRPGTANEHADLARSLCLAVDPDLLVTVRAMTEGYAVTHDPGDPTSTTTPGTGQAAASDWLDELRRIASRMCVVALPFAQADLSALAAVSSPSLTDAALKSPADVVDAVLGVKSVRGLTIPAVGAVDQTGASVLESAKLSQVVTAASSVKPAAPVDGSGVFHIGRLTAATFDQPVSGALAALGTSPTTPALTPPDQRVALADESPVSRRQAALAALAFGAIDHRGVGRDNGPQPVAGRSRLVVPPTYWSPTVDDGTALLRTATVLLGGRTLTPQPLPDVVAAMPGTRQDATFVDPPGVGPVSALTPAVSGDDATAIRRQSDLTRQLQGALISSADVDATPERYMAPLREDLLRALRTPGSSSKTDRARVVADRKTALQADTATLGRMRSAVTILDPGGRYTLASERSPLLLVVRNDLSLPLRVRISTTGPKDLSIGDIGGVEIPARGTRQIQLPTRAESSEATSVTISMRSATGVPLGSRINLSVHSNAYGQALFVITICAGVALVLLIGRRLWHRFRGQPDPADTDRPEADEHERVLAGSTYQHRRRTLHNDGGGSETPPQSPDTPGTGPDETDEAGHE